MAPEEILGIKKQATEETLQSIDGTLKRIEVILRTQLQNRSFVLDDQGQSLQPSIEKSVDSEPLT